MPPSAMVMVIRAMARVVWGRVQRVALSPSAAAFSTSGMATLRVTPPGFFVPSPPSQNLARSFCCWVRFFLISTASTAAAFNSAPLYAGGGGGRNWALLVRTQPFHLPASGSIGGDTTPGAGCQKFLVLVIPAGRLPFHWAPAPSVLP